MENIRIEKYSDTEFKKIVTVPEKVIPEEVREEIMNLKEVKERLLKMNGELDRLQKAKDFDINEYEKAISTHNSMIGNKQKEIDDLQTIITEAEKAGVKETVETPI